MIVLLETVHADAAQMLAEAGEVRLVENPPEVDLRIPADQVRAIVTRGQGQLTATVLRQFPNLEVVARCGAGLDNIDVTAAGDAGVAVVHSPGSTTHAVAEHAVMLMLAMARRVVVLDSAVSAGRWNEIREGFEGTELRGRQMGVIGLGAIGQRVAELGSAFGMEVVHSSRREMGERFRQVGFQELIETSDVIQVCVPLTAETAGLIGPAEFSAMKSGALVVNTARGAIVDHEALRVALDQGTIGGYAADVWRSEPADPGDPLLSNPRVVVTPHIAGLTDTTYREICVRACAALVAVLDGTPPDPRCVFVPPADDQSAPT